MNRLNLLGIILCVGAGCIVLFESLSAVMTAGDIVMQLSSTLDLLGPEAFAWIDRIPVVWIQNALIGLVNLQAWIPVASLGILCFIIAGIRNR